MLIVVEAKVPMAPTMARKISARMSPYSTAVAARSSLMMLKIRRIVFSCRRGFIAPDQQANSLATVKRFLPESAQLQKNPTMIVVAAALADPSGRVLLQRRAPGRAMAGLWEFPGGKVEAGELPEEALVRELEEELGIVVEPADLIPACFGSAPVEGRHMILLVYLCRNWSGEPLPLDASELRWLRPSEMVAADMPPADAPLIALLDRLLLA